MTYTKSSVIFINHNGEIAQAKINYLYIPMWAQRKYSILRLGEENKQIRYVFTSTPQKK